MIALDRPFLLLLHRGETEKARPVSPLCPAIARSVGYGGLINTFTCTCLTESAKPMGNDMESRKDAIKESVRNSVSNAKSFDEPYPHWIVNDFFPDDVYAELRDLPFPAPDLAGVSGTREVHNASRVYFDKQNQAEFPVCREVSEALQDAEIVALFKAAFGGELAETLLRIEYAQDTGGFWLKPHTDIGVKAFTMLSYLSNDPRHADLGTDIYSDGETHYGRPPFVPNSCMIFIPSNHTWHGFEPREIEGIRKSIIVNFVTDEWRAREQLAFPEQPVS